LKVTSLISPPEEKAEIRRASKVAYSLSDAGGFFVTSIASGSTSIVLGISVFEKPHKGNKPPMVPSPIRGKL
jgi:hypothetical protein